MKRIVLFIMFFVLFGCCMRYSTSVSFGDAFETECSIEDAYVACVILIIRFYCLAFSFTFECRILMIFIFFSLL